MTPPSKTEARPGDKKRPGDARREEIMSLIAKIDAVLSEAEIIPDPAEAR